MSSENPKADSEPRTNGSDSPFLRMRERKPSVPKRKKIYKDGEPEISSEKAFPRVKDRTREEEKRKEKE